MKEYKKQEMWLAISKEYSIDFLEMLDGTELEQELEIICQEQGFNWSMQDVEEYSVELWEMLRR